LLRQLVFLRGSEFTNFILRKLFFKTTEAVKNPSYISDPAIFIQSKTLNKISETGKNPLRGGDFTNLNPGKELF
jgi:hypothetical protein